MRPGAVASVVLLTGALVLVAGSAAAQDGIFMGMQKGLEGVFSSVSTTTTFASGAVTKTETTNIYPSLILNLDSLIYPGLRLNAGGVWEVSFMSTDSNGSRVDSSLGRNRPYFQLRSTNPVLAPGFGYSRREERARTAGLASLKLVNDEYAGYLGWNPSGGPQSTFQFIRTNMFDDGRAYQDVTKDFGSIVSTYRYRNLSAYYHGNYLDTDDKLQRVETQQTTHAARVDYSGAFIRNRLLWNAMYGINNQDFKTAVRGTGGEVALPVIPQAGLSGLSDLPATARLTTNGVLIDANLTAGAGVDLGVVTPPEDPQARNIGLDFLNRTEVNRLLVWVDRDLPIEVTNSFSWEIYSSSDNIVWRRESGVSAAPFGPFETRFEINFPSVTERYIKVVTKPLSVVVPDSSRYPDILVTEVQAFLRRPAGEMSSRLEQTTHRVNTDVRMRILDAPSLFYEGFYLYSGPDRYGAETSTLSNGMSLNHTFARIYSAYARAAYEQGTEPRGRRVATMTNATFTVEPMPTLRSSVLYTGQIEEIAGLPNTRRGLFFQNALQPYQGIDVQFGFGWNATTREAGDTAHDQLVNLSATVVPRQRVSLTFSYDNRTTRQSGTFAALPESRVQRTYALVAVDPTRTLHLALGGEVLVMTAQRTRTTLDVGVNWAPFPEGTLQFVFAYNEALRALEFGSDRNTLGSIRWNLSRKSYVDLTLQRTKSEFVFQTTESRIASVTVRLFF